MYSVKNDCILSIRLLLSSFYITWKFKQKATVGKCIWLSTVLV